MPSAQYLWLDWETRSIAFKLHTAGCILAAAAPNAKPVMGRVLLEMFSSLMALLYE